MDLTPEEQPVEELMEETEDANLQQDVGMDSEVAKNEEERSNREQSREESGGEVCVEQTEAAIQLGQVTFIEDINIRSKLEAEKEEPFTFVLPPSAVEDDPVNQITMVSCTDEQQSRLVYVLVEVSQQADPSSRTGYGMEIRGDDSRVEAVRMELPDSFVAPDDSSMVSMQMDSQASPKPYYVDSSMQSPEVMMGTVVGELEFVNKAASLSSNHSEQEAKVVISENDQPLSNMEVGVLNMNSVQDEFEETSDGAGSTEEPTCSTRIQSGAFSFQNEERGVDMPKDYDTDWNVHVHVENKNKGISIMERSAGKDNERSKKLELPEEVHDGVVIIEGKVHFDDIYETPYVNLKIGVAACEDDSMCPALDLSDSSNL